MTMETRQQQYYLPGYAPLQGPPQRYEHAYVYPHNNNYYLPMPMYTPHPPPYAPPPLPCAEQHHRCNYLHKRNRRNVGRPARRSSKKKAANRSSPILTIEQQCIRAERECARRQRRRRNRELVCRNPGAPERETYFEEAAFPAAQYQLSPWIPLLPPTSPGHNLTNDDDSDPDQYFNPCTPEYTYGGPQHSLAESQASAMTAPVKSDTYVPRTPALPSRSLCKSGSDDNMDADSDRPMADEVLESNVAALNRHMAKQAVLGDQLYDVENLDGMGKISAVYAAAGRQSAASETPDHQAEGSDTSI